MLPSIAQILALPPVQAGHPQVLGGGSLDTPVRWVHVSDVADLTGMLSGGELVLTVGSAMVDPAAARDYLPGLQRAGAVGLCVELGRVITEIAPDFVEQADELGFPLIVLRRQIRFVEVTEAVHRSIVAEQYAELEFARHVHEAFAELTMRRADMAEIVAAAAEMIDAPIVVEDLNHQVLLIDTHGESTAELLTDWERRSRLTPDAEGLSRGGPQDWLVVPVGPRRQQWGRLVVTRADHSERQRLVLERAAQALAMRRMVEQDRNSLEQQAQSGLLEDLRQGRIVDEAEATARAHSLGLRPARSYIPMTLRITHSARADQVVAQRRQVRLLDAARHAVRASGQTALTASAHAGRIDIVVAQPSAATVDEMLAGAAAQIRVAVLRLDGVTHCAIGVGPSSARLLDAVGGLEEAAHVAEVALALPDTRARPRRPFHRAVDIRLRGLLALLAGDPRVQAFAESELRGILDHRARHDDDTYDILRAFLAVGGNKTELAKRMRMSRPTLYTRLATISRILGVDLEDAESRTSLHTAVMIMDTTQGRALE